MIQNIGAPARAPDKNAAAAATKRDEASALIRRYPNLSETELARLINLYRELPAVDMALMLSSDELKPNLDRFTKDHRRSVRTPFRHYAALIGYAALAIIAVAWAASVAA